jgi:hypothetical protein
VIQRKIEANLLTGSALTLLVPLGLVFLAFLVRWPRACTTRGVRWRCRWLMHATGPRLTWPMSRRQQVTVPIADTLVARGS